MHYHAYVATATKGLQRLSYSFMYKIRTYFSATLASSPSARQPTRPCSRCGFQLSPEVPINHVIKVFYSHFRTVARLRHMLLRHLIETLIQAQTFVYLITITGNFHPPIFQLSYLNTACMECNRATYTEIYYSSQKLKVVFCCLV